MSDRVRILSSDRDNSKYFISEQVKLALEVNYTLASCNSRLDMFFGYDVVAHDVNIHNRSLIVFLKEAKTTKSDYCPHCHSADLYLHDKCSITVADCPICGLKTKLHITKQRYRCKSCGKTHTVGTDFKVDGFKMTPRLYAQIAYELSLADRSVESVSKELGVYWNAVKAIDKMSLEKKFEYIPTDNVRCIAMDEISIRKRHSYATVIIDAETRRMLYVCEGRKKEDIQPFFDLLKKRKHDVNILGASMDANAGFAAIVKDNCPNAKIALDQFHMVANFNRVIDAIRLRVVKAKRAQLKADDLLTKQIADDLKRLKWLIYRSYKDVMSDVQIKDELKDMIKSNEDISIACILADELRNLWRDTYKTPAQIRIDALNWVKKCMNTGIEEIMEFARKFEKHIEDIINAASLGLSNSVLEGCNSKAKVIKRISYGFRDMKYYFLKLFQAFQGKTPLRE